MRFVRNLILATACEFYYDTKYGDIAVEVDP